MCWLLFGFRPSPHTVAGKPCCLLEPCRVPAWLPHLQAWLDLRICTSTHNCGHLQPTAPPSAASTRHTAATAADCSHSKVAMPLHFRWLHFSWTPCAAALRCILLLHAGSLLFLLLLQTVWTMMIWRCVCVCVAPAQRDCTPRKALRCARWTSRPT